MFKKGLSIQFALSCHYNIKYNGVGCTQESVCMTTAEFGGGSGAGGGGRGEERSLLIKEIQRR